MKVAFFSNFLNHHQLPFCLAMDRLTEGNFTFVATCPISQERIKLGYKDMDHSYPFVLTAYDSEDNKRKAMELARGADVIITGSAPEKYTSTRVKKGLLTFRYSERPYKQGISLKKLPRYAASSFLHHGRYALKPLYMLCASAYTAGDYARFGTYLGKCYKWGYFPEVKEENLGELFALKRSNSRPVLLWAGRLISCKHPEMAIELAEKLKKKGRDFELQIIGNGMMEAQLRNMIMEKGLEDTVYMPGALPPENVRAYMEKANIFLFTSDFYEGWGAVLNESMNSGCAVVASHAIGSVPFLIKQGENGLIFRNEDQNDLNQNVIKLLDNPALAETLGSEAYKTLSETWNADFAAERLLVLINHLKNGNKGSPFKDGPCSKAGTLNNNWFCP